MPRETWVDADIDTLKRLWPTGATATEIAAHLTISFSRSAIIGKARRIGLPARSNPVPPNDYLPQRKFERLIDLVVDKNVSVDMAARSVDLDLDTARSMWTALAARYGEAA